MSEEPVIYRVDRGNNAASGGESEEFRASMQRVVRAHDELLRRLLGFVPERPGDYIVTRRDYAKAMQSVQKEFGLVEGDPDFILFVLEQLSRSPRFVNEEEWG